MNGYSRPVPRQNAVDWPPNRAVGTLRLGMSTSLCRGLIRWSLLNLAQDNLGLSIGHVLFGTS
jgi:hypothetical protein